jgi:hypothetical protein
MDVEFVRYLASLGVGGAIAGLMFMAYRRDVQTYTAQWKGQTELLVEVVREVTKAITANTEVIRALHDRLDRMNGP